MLITHNADEYETIVEHTICEYHKKYPRDINYAGCACSTTYTLRRKPKWVQLVFEEIEDWYSTSKISKNT